MGIGKDINRETLELIASDKPFVVMVENFDELKDKIEEIKSKACSGKLTSLVTLTFSFPLTQRSRSLGRLL